MRLQFFKAGYSPTGNATVTVTANSKLHAVTITANNKLFAVTVTANNKLFEVTVAANNFFLTNKVLSW